MRFTSLICTILASTLLVSASPIAEPEAAPAPVSSNETTLDIAARAPTLACSSTPSVSYADAYKCAEWLVNDRPDEVLTAFGVAKPICSVGNYGTAYWSLQNGPQAISAPRRVWGNAVYGVIDGCRSRSNTHTGGTMQLAESGPLSTVLVLVINGPLNV